MEGATVRLPIGTDVQAGDHLEHQLANDEIRRMVVVDVVSPYMFGASEDDDHIEVTCVPAERVALEQFSAPVLHPAMAVAVKLLEDGRACEAVTEALRLVEQRVRSLTASGSSGRMLMESAFGTSPAHLDITTATGHAAEVEREGFRFLFIGAMLGLGAPHEEASAMPATLAETLEYLAVASMLMRRLDLAETRLG